MTRSASFPSVEPGKKKPRNTTGREGTEPISADAFDAKHDRGEDVSDHVDWTKARRPGREIQRVNVDFPIDLLTRIDREAKRIGVSRQAFIKLRLADGLPEAG